MNEIKYPPSLQLEVTPLCNHNCVHCYNYWRATDEIMDNPSTDFSLIAEKIIENKPLHVVITGGEPLLQFERLKAPIKQLIAAEIYVSFNTNATLVTEEIADFMRDHNMSAFISLPSCVEKICDEITSVSGSFPAIVQGIRTLKAHDIRVSVNMVVSKLNIDTVYDTALFAYDELNVNSFYASPVSKPINSSDVFDQLMLSAKEIQHMEVQMMQAEKARQIHTEISTSLPYCSFFTQEISDHFSYKKHCTAGRFSYALDYNGNVKACPRDSKEYGNIFQMPFSQIWSDMREWRDGSLLPQECKSCRSLSVCGGGCRLENLPHTNRRDMLDQRADLAYAPLRFPRPQKDYPFSDEQLFRTNRNLKRIKEDFGTQISAGNEYLYVTDKFSDYLAKSTHFSLHELHQFFPRCSVEDTKKLIELLITMRILIPTEGSQA